MSVCSVSARTVQARPSARQGMLMWWCLVALLRRRKFGWRGESAGWRGASRVLAPILGYDGGPDALVCRVGRARSHLDYS